MGEILSRISDAWAALRGRPRVVTETVYAPGQASVVDVFMGEKLGGLGSYKTKVYYATCAQAHAEHYGRIQRVQVMKFSDGGLYGMPEGGYLRPIRLQPKPKRAKGAK